MSLIHLFAEAKKFDFKSQSVIMNLVKIKRSKFSRIFPKVVSASLVFWLSNVLILVCCGTMISQVSAQEPVPECHKHQTADNSNKISETETNNYDCCVFKPNKTLSEELQKQQNVKQSPAVTEQVQISEPIYFTKQIYKSPAIYHSAIRNRGSTYLKNCVFRI